jgi:hypothetical protein
MDGGCHSFDLVAQKVLVGNETSESLTLQNQATLQ